MNKHEERVRNMDWKKAYIDKLANANFRVLELERKLDKLEATEKEYEELKRESMNKHEEAKQLVNETKMGVSLTRLRERELKLLDYIFECEATEKRLQELERDVKRYFDFIGDEETDEYIELFQKLSKVGNE